MLHQIRKLIGTMLAVVRGELTEDDQKFALLLAPTRADADGARARRVQLLQPSSVASSPPARENVSAAPSSTRRAARSRRTCSVGDPSPLTEAPCENLFMILVSTLNQIPIFVIGKPGSSKSLAMALASANLNGDASADAFLRALPAVEVFPYQCSPLSTSDGIEQTFESARRYRREAAPTRSSSCCSTRSASPSRARTCRSRCCTRCSTRRARAGRGRHLELVARPAPR